MAQLGGQPVPKKDAAPLSDDLDSQTPLRITEFKRDILGRLIHTLARDNDQIQETAYQEEYFAKVSFNAYLVIKNHTLTLAVGRMINF